MKTRPLITFVLLAYNQQRFIRDAVNGAFTQTYSPLEIILSDDCSSDRTYETLQDMVASYKGPHKVGINRTPKNRGIAAHINDLTSKINGELVVMAAGDDISEPDRTEALATHWESSNPRVDCIYSSYTLIDQQGIELENHFSEMPKQTLWQLDDIVKKGTFSTYGCSSAYSKDIFKAFPPLQAGVLYEDMVLPFRALIKGGVGYIPNRLIRYRQHDKCVYNTPDINQMYHLTNKKALNDYAVAVQWLVDYCFVENPDPKKIVALSEIINSKLEEVVLFKSSRLMALKRILGDVVSGGPQGKHARRIAQHVLKLSPHALRRIEQRYLKI